MIKHVTVGKDLRGPLMPAHVDHINRFFDAATGKKDRFGRSRNMLYEFLSTFTGARLNMIEGDVAMQFKAIEFRNDMASIKQPLLIVAKDDQSSVSDLASSLSDFRKRSENLYSQASTAIRGAVNLGTPISKVRKILSDDGISKDDIRHMISGKPRHYVPGGATKREILQSENGREKFRLFMDKK